MTKHTGEEVLETIQHLLHNLHDIDLEPAVLAATRWQATGLESLALMELVLHLERDYAVTVENEALRHVATFGDLAALVAKLTEGSEAPAASSAVEALLLRRIWVLLAEAHHIETPLETLAARRWSEPELVGLRLPVLMALEADFGVMLNDTESAATLGAFVQLVAEKITHWPALEPAV